MIIKSPNLGIEIDVTSFDRFDQGEFCIDGKPYTGVVHNREGYLFVLNFLEGKLHSTFNQPSFMSLLTYNDGYEVQYIKYHINGKLIKMQNVSEDNHVDYIHELGWLEFILSATSNV